MHSSRMRTSRSLTVCQGVCVGGCGRWCLPRGVSAQGVSTQGVSAWGLFLPGGGCLPRGGLSALATTSLQPVINKTFTKADI